jgi:hypothetical protein
MGYVYLIVDWGSNPEMYKIGITKKNVENRLKQLQTGSSSKLVLLKTYQSENYRKIETILHRIYGSYSSDGGKEWFQIPTKKVMGFINECEKIDENLKFLSENSTL